MVKTVLFNNNITRYQTASKAVFEYTVSFVSTFLVIFVNALTLLRKKGSRYQISNIE